jgi:hypothetical protein
MIWKLASSTITVSIAVIVGALIFPPLFASPRQGRLPRMSGSQQSSISVTRRNAKMMPPSVSRSHLASYGHLPMRFEENIGQTDNRVRFISHGPGYTLFLTADEAVFKPSGHGLASVGKWRGPKSVRDRLLSKETEASVVRMKLKGAKGTTTITGLDKLPGVSNYFIGQNPNKWHKGVASYAKVRYSEIYSGIDLVYYGTGNRVEYDFIVKPGADPKQVLLSFDGAEKISRDTNSGDVSIPTVAGKMALQKPVLYQIERGQKKIVECNYKFQGNDQLGFDVGDYDRSEPLVIDPVLAYSTYLGGSNQDDSYGMTVDSSGNAFVAGSTWSVDFPVAGTSISAAPLEGYKMFVSEINPSGTALVYSTYIGGTSGYEWATGIAVDSNGYAYITGVVSSGDFPVTSNAYQTSYGSGAVENAALCKLSADGQSLLYSTLLGGTVADEGYGIAVDSAENAYLTGYTSSFGFPTTSNAVQSTLKGSKGNAFVTRIDTTQSGTSSLVYSTFLGGTSTTILESTEGGSAIGIDSQKDIYVAGTACSPDFPVTPNAFKTTGSVDSCSAFLSQIDTTQSGSAGLIYSTYFGGTASGDTFDIGYGLALDSSNKVYVSGSSTTSDFPTTTGATNSVIGKAFVAKFDTTKSNANSLIYSTLFGGSSGISNDAAAVVAVDFNGNAYLAGWTFGTDFPFTPEASQSTLGGAASTFLTVVNEDASRIIYSTYWGGTNNFSFSYGLALDTDNNMYVTGFTYASDMETTTGAIQPSGSGRGNDAYVAKFTALTVPRISSLSPPCGPNGADIRINGLNFGSTQESSTVTFGAEIAPIVSWSDTAIVAQVPAFAPLGSLQTTVTTALESSNLEPFVVLSGHVESRRRSHNRLECNEHYRDCADWGDGRECGRDTRRIRRERSESAN